MTRTGTIPDQREYAALRDGAALHLRPQMGLLELGGRDGIDFLQRLTTNDIARLAPGGAGVTVLTSPVARIEAVFTVLVGSEGVRLLPYATAPADLAQKLRSQIFFMDKVTVVDHSEHLSRLRLMGPDACRALEAAGLPCPEDDRFAVTDDIVVLAQPSLDVPGYEVVMPAQRGEQIQDALAAAGVLVVGAAALDVRRVELGRPAPGRELTGEVTPLEAGLAWTCAENKGCYTGQEIIARQLTYDKVTRGLVGLCSESHLAEGSQITADGRKVGMVTSGVYSPSLDAPIALAIVKRPFNEPGSRVVCDGAEVTVVSLPFVA